jgi:hypothetical protein
MVNWDWGQADHVSQLINLECPMKVLRGRSVLCLGQEFVPSPRDGSRVSIPLRDTKTVADQRHVRLSAQARRTTVNEGMGVVPRIVLAMGADLVEAAADPGSSSSSDLSAFDLVLVKAQDDMAHVQLAKGHIVHLPWLKDCLITNRLHPFPCPAA